MVSLKTKILIILMIIGLPLCGQSFNYSYIDPCTKQNKFIYADMSAPIVIAYYGQIQTFTYTQLYNGEFDGWINNIYNKYKTTSPCQGVLTTTITTTSTNQVSNIIGNISGLLNLDLSSINNVSVNVAEPTSSAGEQNKTNKTNKKDGNANNINNNSNNNDASNSNNQSSKDNKKEENKTNSEGNKKTNNGENGGETNGSKDGKNNNGGKTGDNKNQESKTNSEQNKNSKNQENQLKDNSTSNNTSSNKDNNTGEINKDNINNQKTNIQKDQSRSSVNAASKAKTETQKPAILLTGDIVGVQTKSDGAQDARGTISFTRVKGDGTSSLGLSADYMVNAKIGNISCIRSWIGTNKKGNKHINVVSAGLGILPNSLTSNALFVRVNSLKNFTALYGVAGTYGKLYKEELISTIAIGGFMYKGKVTKTLDATVIMAGIYSPYSKFYTESIFEAKPIVIPFLNLNYKLTKTFGVGLTAGGTYVANQDVLNYQVLLGAKLKI